MGTLASESGFNPKHGRRLDALIVEDVEGDARLIVKALIRGGFSVNFERVESQPQMAQALDRRHWDLVISDCSLPKFSAMRAIELVQERKLDVPVIVVSGVVQEDAAAQVLNAGAHDFLPKSSLARLVPAVERELDGVAQRAAQVALQRELERRAQQSERRFRNLFDLAPDGVIVVNAEGRVSEVNRRACAMFDYTSSDMIGLPIESIVPAFRLKDLTQTGATRPATPAHVAEMHARRRDGRNFPVEVSMDSATTSTVGSSTIISVRDVSERERNREELHVALAETKAIRDQLDSVLDCAPAVIVALDVNGAIKFINRVKPGRRKEDVIGAEWVSFVPPLDRERTRQHLQSVLRTGVPTAFELGATDADDNVSWYACHMGPMRGGDDVTGAVIIAQDITEVRHVRDELAAAQRLAAVGTLAAGVAHEINTPMQFVNDSLHFLREGSRDVMTLVDKLKALLQFWVGSASANEIEAVTREVAAAEEAVDLEYLVNQMPIAFDRCIDGLERMTGIVRSLKEFSHPATQEASPVDLNRAIQATLTIARNEYKYVADLETDYGELPLVLCHVNDINQVVLNLVVNAAHAITDQLQSNTGKGVIRVATRCDEDWIVISVSDSGTGIPEHVRHRIFEPFFTTKEVGKGTGQGLALAWSLVTEKHRGQLTFETELGQGTTFFVRLPLTIG